MAAKKPTHQKPGSTTNVFPENNEPMEGVDEVHEEALTAEERAFKKSQKEGFDANRVENPYSTSMSEKEAKEIVKKYDGTKPLEEPNELKRAKEVIKNSK